MKFLKFSNVLYLFVLHISVFWISPVQCLPDIPGLGTPPPPLTLSLERADIGFDPNEARTLQIEFEPVENEEVNNVFTPNRLLTRKKQVFEGYDVFGFGGTWQQGQADPIIVIYADLRNVKDKLNEADGISIQDAFDNAFRDCTGMPRARARRRGLVSEPETPSYDRYRKVVFVDPLKEINTTTVYLFDFLLMTTSMDFITHVFSMVDTKTGAIVRSFKQLLSNQFMMKGVGGNTLVGKHFYGEGAWAGRMLKVTKNGNKCIPRNDEVWVNSLHKTTSLEWPPSNCFKTNLNTVDQFEEPCNPKEPNIDQTESSFSQVHDALFYSNKFVDLLRDKYADNVLTTNCSELRVCVHWQDPISFFFQEGDEEQPHPCMMYYGVGGTLTVDNVTPDLVGHEIGHAYTFVTSRLDPRGQSGAIMESFSDLSGIFLKASLNKFETDWKFGADMIRQSINVPDEGPPVSGDPLLNIFVPSVDSLALIRHMNDPKLDGKSIDHSSDFKNQDVHYTSGVYNKAIYNLATTTNWDIQKVMELFIRANRFYWHATTDFDNGTCGLQEAARDLNFTVDDVTNAFAKVGAFCDCPLGWQKVVNTVKLGDNNQEPSRRTSCYKFVQDPATWAEANTYCTLMNGRLAQVRDNEAHEGILSVMTAATSGGNKKKNKKKNKAGGGYWLGANDFKQQGVWKWAGTDEVLEFDKWHNKQPANSSGGKHCLTMSIVNGKWGWSNELCSTANAYICQLG